MAQNQKGNDDGDQNHERQESKFGRAEAKAEVKVRGEASEGMHDHNKKLVAAIQEKRTSRKSGVTGAFAENGNKGLASGDLLLPLEKATRTIGRAFESVYKAGGHAVSETGKFLKGMGDGEVEFVKELGDSINVAGDYYGRALSGKVNLAADLKEFSGAIGQTLGTAGDYYFKQLPKGQASLGKDISEAGKAAGDHWNSLDTEHKGKFFGKELVPLLVPGAAGMVVKDAQAANLVGTTGKAITALAGSEKVAELEQKITAIQSKLQQMQELAKPLKPAYEVDGPRNRPFLPEIPAKNDNLFAMSNEADGLRGEQRGFRSKGMDSTGKALTFSQDSGIELETARQGQDKVWEQAPFPRGDDVHVVLGENLPSGTKTIDRVVFRDGIAESQKSIDLTAPTYQSPNALESRLSSCMHDLEIYSGQPKMRSGFIMKNRQVHEKVLHIGIQDGVMNPDQKRVFEKIGKAIQAYNETLPVGKAPIKFKVTVVK